MRLPILFTLFPIIIFAQESNLSKALNFEIQLKKRNVNKYLSYTIHKDGEPSNQYRVIGYIEIYDDSLIFHKFWVSNKGVVNKFTKKITNRQTIKYVNYYYLNFTKYKPKCDHFFASPGHLHLTKKMWRRNIQFSKKEWTMFKAKLLKNNVYDYNFSFKSRLFRFDCLGFFKNLKSRHMFRKLIRLLEKSK